MVVNAGTATYKWHFEKRERHRRITFRWKEEYDRINIQYIRAKLKKRRKRRRRTALNNLERNWSQNIKKIAGSVTLHHGKISQTV